MNSLRWIKSIGSGASEIAIKFHPLPGGEGRGEGERKHKFNGGLLFFPRRKI
jgi:hypothetical protein